MDIDGSKPWMKSPFAVYALWGTAQVYTVCLFIIPGNDGRVDIDGSEPWMKFHFQKNLFTCTWTAGTGNAEQA